MSVETHRILWPKIAIKMSFVGMALVLSTFGGNIVAYSQPVTLHFKGNKNFTSEELSKETNKCFAQYKESESINVDYCFRQLASFLRTRGYFRAVVTEERRQRLNDRLVITALVDEGTLYHLGDVTIHGSTIFSAEKIREMLPLKRGDVANAQVILEWAFVRLKKAYNERGYIRCTPDIEPTYRGEETASNGLVDLVAEIDEGQIYYVRSIDFDGNSDIPKEYLGQQMSLQSGAIFNGQLLGEGLKRINQTGYFETIDEEKDVDYLINGNEPRVDVKVHLRRRAKY